MKAAKRNEVDLIVFDDDDSSSVPASTKVGGGMQSDGKSAPLTPSRSSAVIKLREQVAKWERQLQEQFVEADRKAESAAKLSRRVIELTRERDALKDEMEVMRRNTHSLRERNAQLWERVGTLTQQVEAVSREQRAVYRSRIDELAQSEFVAQQYSFKSARQEPVLAPPPEKMMRMDEWQSLKKALEEVETSKTLQHTLDGAEWGSIRESEALEEYNNFKISSKTLFRRGDDGTPRTLATLMRWNGSEDPFSDFPEPSIRNEARKRPHEEEEIEAADMEEGRREKEEKGWLQKWTEFERVMRGKMCGKAGAPGARILGLLMGRKKPPHRGDEQTSVLSVQNLMGLAKELRGLEGNKVNSIMNISQFVCICGANIQNGVTLLKHFNAAKHIKKSSQPVYQSDVDFWIETIDEVKDRKWARDLYNS